MAPKGTCEGKGKISAKANIPTLLINRRLSLDWDCIKGFIAEHIRGLMRIYNDCGVNDNGGWDIFNNIMFRDPVMIHHINISSCCGATTGVGGHHVGSGGQRSAHMWPK
jgi:hypothetical protein